MAAPGPEWLLWAKRMKDEHVNLVQSLERISSTVAKAPLPAQFQDLEASQEALRQEVDSLREALVLAEKQYHQCSKHSDARIKALEEEVKLMARARAQDSLQAGERMLKLQEEVAGPKRGDGVARELDVSMAGMGIASELTATNLAKISVTPSQRSSMQISLEDSAQRDRNASMPAQKYTSSFRRLDSDETRDSSETSDGLQYTNASVPVAFRSPTPFERPDASPSITSSQSPRIFQPAEPLENASPASLVNNAGVLLANGAPLHASGTPPAQTFALPSAALQPQRGLELVEYLIISEDEIMDRLPQYEKRLVEAFVNGMSDGDQKAALQATLNERAWTWKTAFEAVNQIVNEATAAKKKRRKPKSSSAKKATLSPRRDANGRFASKRPKII